MIRTQASINEPLSWDEVVLNAQLFGDTIEKDPSRNVLDFFKGHGEYSHIEIPWAMAHILIDGRRTRKVARLLAQSGLDHLDIREGSRYNGGRVQSLFYYIFCDVEDVPKWAEFGKLFYREYADEVYAYHHGGEKPKK